MPRDPATHVGIRLWIDDEEIPCDPESLEPGALSGLKVTWGRAGRLEKPAATTCDLELVDPDGGAMGYQDRVSYDSEVRVSAVLPSGSGRYVFIGKVTDLEVAHDAVGDSIIKVTAIDYTARLSSVNMGDTPWPQQSSQARWAAIVAAVPAGVDVAIPNTVPDATMAAMDVDNQSVAQVVEDFAWGLGRIPWPLTTAVAGSLSDVGAGYRFTSGTFSGSTTDNRPSRRNPTYGIGSGLVVCIDACDVDMDGTTFVANPDDTPQPIRVTWGGNSDVTGTYVLDNVGNVQDTTRRFDVSSGVVESSADDAALAWYGQMAKWTQDFDAPWRVGTLRVDPDTITGIDTFDVAMRYLLDYSERIERTILLQLLPSWTPWRDASAHTHEPNVLGRLQGGTYTFDEGRWVLDLQVSVERALVGDLAPAKPVEVRPGDVVPYDHNTTSVTLVAVPSTRWAVGAIANFTDGQWGWDGTAWVRGGVAAIYVNPGDTTTVPHDDDRVRPSPTTAWAARTYATFSDGRYQWSGGDWVAMVTAAPASIVTVAHDAPNVLPNPTSAWAPDAYATFSDGAYRWDGEAWVLADVTTLYVRAYDTMTVAHTDERLVPVPTTAWWVPGSGSVVMAPAWFSDGTWSWQRTYWQRVYVIKPGDTSSRNAIDPTTTPWPTSAWAATEHATLAGAAYRWSGTAWVPWVPAWKDAPEGMAWQDVPTGTAWSDWDGEA